MIEVEIPAETEEDFSSVATPETLVPGINPAFLRNRVIVPLGTQGAAMRWGILAPEDQDTLDALRFASRAPIAPVRLPEATIRTLLGVGPGLTREDFRDRASTRQVPHAEAVIRLRAHLVAAISTSADRVEIRAIGDLLMQRAGREVARHDLGTVEANALTAAAVALAGIPGTDAPGVPVAHCGRHMRVTIEPSPTGVALLLATTEPR